jgi:16S rRNA (uracil1498-N3)-methyltransferase
MNNIRLFYQQNLSNNLKGKLDKKQSHYISKVMRIKENGKFNVFNNAGEWVAKIIRIANGFVEFRIVKQLRSIENANEIWLAFSPIKSNYFNFMIHKATEIGVTRFIPILTERTIVRKLNEKRINKIIIEASEQSNRLKVPSLDKLTKLDAFLKLNQNTNIIFGDINSENKKMDLKNKNPLCVLIGPEGDFSLKERERILKLKNIIPLKINDNILRSETAAISMISIISFNLLS